MKRLLLVILLTLFTAVLFTQGCDRPESPQPSGGSPQPVPLPSASPAPQPRKLAEPVTSEVWPPPPPAGTEITVADNLFTKNYYVVYDCSGSMTELDCSGQMVKEQAAKRALSRFAKIVPTDANLGLLTFENNRIREIVPLGTGNRDNFVKAVLGTMAGGATPLRTALEQGYKKLEEQARRQLGYGDYTLVVVTDGAASEGEDPTAQVNWLLGATPVQLHTIGFCIGTDHSLNMPGRTVYKAADNLEELSKGLEDVLSEADVFDVTEFNQ